MHTISEVDNIITCSVLIYRNFLCLDYTLPNNESEYVEAENQAGAEKLEEEGHVDEEVDREDKKVVDKLQIRANAEAMLLCQHRKRTSVA